MRLDPAPATPIQRRSHGNPGAARTARLKGPRWWLPDSVRAAPTGIRTQTPSGLPYRRGLLRAAWRRRHLDSSSRATAGGPGTRASLDRFRGRGLDARPGLGAGECQRAASAPSGLVGPVGAGCSGELGFGSDPGPRTRPVSSPRPGSASCLTLRPQAQLSGWRWKRSGVVRESVADQLLMSLLSMLAWCIRDNPPSPEDSWSSPL
ncbi:uncharacterized protein [Odocoileus virginianus]|uniref:Uncharacterized protein isoform X2 n=1 Tax=Odocoileus virginianus TaxID=9874 RepID=A0ABM4HST4_ODOVR